MSFPEEQIAPKRGRQAKGRKANPHAFSMYDRDQELIEKTAAYLGCSRSEAVRTAVRSFAAFLGYLDGWKAPE